MMGERKGIICQLRILLDFDNYEYVFAISSKSCDCASADDDEIGFAFDVTID